MEILVFERIDISELWVTLGSVIIS
jgi:hypothetical protein